MSVYDKIFPPKLLTLPNGKQVSKPRSRAPLAAVILVAMTALSVEVTGFDMGVLVSRIREFFVILGEMIPPEWDYMSQIWQPLFDTIKMSLLGSFIGSILVVPFAMLASTNIIHSRVIVAAMRLLLSIIRTLPTLVSALIATYIFGLGTLAGTTAIAIFTFAYIGKILYEEIETVDMGPFEAMEAMGATKVRAFISSIVPQVLPSYLSNCLFCFEGNVRYASILGYVGAGGLGDIAVRYGHQRGITSVMWVTVVFLVILVQVVQLVFNWLSRRIDKRLDQPSGAKKSGPLDLLARFAHTK